MLPRSTGFFGFFSGPPISDTSSPSLIKPRQHGCFSIKPKTLTRSPAPRAARSPFPQLRSPPSVEAPPVPTVVFRGSGHAPPAVSASSQHPPNPQLPRGKTMTPPNIPMTLPFHGLPPFPAPAWPVQFCDLLLPRPSITPPENNRPPQSATPQLQLVLQHAVPKARLGTSIASNMAKRTSRCHPKDTIYWF